MILPFCSQHSRGGGWEATAPVTDGGPDENFGDGMSYLTALLSNLVWKGSRNVVSYSLYTEREKNSGKTGAAPAGRRDTRPWEVDGLLQIGICDDARESRFQLRVLLERALEGRSAPARLLEFSSGDALLGWMDRHAGELDLVFLDIEMEGTNGMDTARAPAGGRPEPPAGICHRVQ